MQHQDLGDLNCIYIRIFRSVLVFVLWSKGSRNYPRICFGMLYNDGTQDYEFNMALNNRCKCWLTQPMKHPP